MYNYNVITHLFQSVKKLLLWLTLTLSISEFISLHTRDNLVSRAINSCNKKLYILNYSFVIVNRELFDGHSIIYNSSFIV